MEGRLARRHLWVLGLLVLATVAGPVSRGWGQVDPNLAVKRLLAANGFFRRGLFKMAASEYSKFLVEFPAHADATTARYGLAICRYRLNQYGEAAKLLGEVLKDQQFKQRDEALAVLGHCQLTDKAYDKALATFQELLAKHPSSKHVEAAALNRAQVLYLLGKTAESLGACQEFLKKHPRSARRAAAEYFAALAQEALGKHAEAATALAGLLKDYPNSPYELDATLLLGQCLEADGKLPEATARYRKFLSSVPPGRQAEGFYSLGVVLYKAGKHAESIKQLSTVLTKHGESQYAAPARLQLGLAELAIGKPAQARKTLTLVASKDPARAVRARYWLAQCDMAEKKYVAARAGLEALASAKAAPPNLEAILFDRAVCTMALDQHAAAAKEFQAFRAKYPKSAQLPEATYRQAFCLHKQGKYPESLALCNAAGTSKAVAAAVAELVAENLFLMGRYGQAQKAFTGLAKTAGSPEAKIRTSFRLGQCAYFTGDYAKAVTLLGPVAADRKATQDDELREAAFLMGDAQLQTGQYKQAARTLAKYLAASKRNRQEAQFKLALAQLRGGDAANASRTLAAVMNGPATSPWVQRALFEYGQLAYKQKDPAKAAPALQKVVAANAPAELAAPATYLLGWIDFDAGRHPQAATRFAQVVQKYPKHALVAEASFQEAVCLKQSGKPQQALTKLQAYIKAYPAGKNIGQARHLVGTCLAELGQHGEAIKSLSALAADEKTCTETVLYELAWSQRSAKDGKAAVATYGKLLAKFPSGKLATAARAELAELLYQEKKYTEAAALLVKVLADTKAEVKTLTVAQYRVGWCYTKLDDTAKAAEAFAAFVSKYAKDALAPSAMYQAGLAFALLKKLPEAQRHFGRLLAEHPNHELAPVACLKLGEVQNAGREFPKAAATFQGFLQKRPKDKYAYLAQFGIGWAMENLKKHDEARKWYALVIAKHDGPTAARAQFQTGETHFAQGSFDEAIQELLKVEFVYAYPEWSARALYEAGMAFEQLKKLDEAKKQYVLCVKKYAKQPASKLAEAKLKALGVATP